jgi:hypothetical protein
MNRFRFFGVATASMVVVSSLVFVKQSHGQDVSPTASSTVPQTTFPVGNPPTDSDVFPEKVTLRSGLQGTLLKKSEVPLGWWEFVSYEVYPDSYLTRRKYPPRLKMKFPKNAAVVSFSFSSTYFSPAGHFVGPWYRTEQGCLETFWPFQVASTTQGYGYPSGESAWLQSTMYDKICGFFVKGGILTILVNSRPGYLPEGALTTFTLRKISAPKNSPTLQQSSK